MIFTCFGGQQINADSSAVQVLNNQFIYLENQDTIVNYKTVSHDYDFNANLDLLGNTLDKVIGEKEVEIGLSFGGYVCLSGDTDFGQVKFGMPELEKLVPINKENFWGRVLTNINPSISMGRSQSQVPLLRGTITKLEGSSLFGEFSFNGRIVNFIKLDWIDYLKF